MSNPSGIGLSVGARSLHIFEKDPATGLVKVSSTTPSAGSEFLGPKALTLNVPEAREIVHIGKDRVLAVDLLPPNTPLTGEVRVGEGNMIINALVSGVKTRTSGEGIEMAWATDKQGYEPQFGMFMYHQSLQPGHGRIWRSVFIPTTRMFPYLAGMGENPEDGRYKVAPSPSEETLWGEAFSDSVWGCTEATNTERYTFGKPNMMFAAGDGTTDDFDLGITTIRAASLEIWVAGTKETNWTETGGVVTFAAQHIPADDALISFRFEV
jgi:hypothetical protein